ncbi:hypothetical protein M011DRAFT_528328 [Sporormia fimetaria CBS 119925]|uniref:Uncharacterized protein n=1 Tax=Sporormia fimetaria CBS 119925 TaxID=1340428 RepID=A0A6A6V217_9PLEO|nr:hypothetical protein M011DRAFT_528328 [Sporormia fimetaria CBS 119925]
MAPAVVVMLLWSWTAQRTGSGSPEHVTESVFDTEGMCSGGPWRGGSVELSLAICLWGKRRILIYCGWCRWPRLWVVKGKILSLKELMPLISPTPVKEESNSDDANDLMHSLPQETNVEVATYRTLEERIETTEDSDLEDSLFVPGSSSTHSSLFGGSSSTDSALFTHDIILSDDDNRFDTLECFRPTHPYGPTAVADEPQQSATNPQSHGPMTLDNPEFREMHAYNLTNRPDTPLSSEWRPGTRSAAPSPPSDLENKENVAPKPIDRHHPSWIPDEATFFKWPEAEPEQAPASPQASTAGTARAFPDALTEDNGLHPGVKRRFDEFAHEFEDGEIEDQPYAPSSTRNSYGDRHVPFEEFAQMSDPFLPERAPSSQRGLGRSRVPSQQLTSQEASLSPSYNSTPVEQSPIFHGTDNAEQPMRARNNVQKCPRAPKKQKWKWGMNLPAYCDESIYPEETLANLKHEDASPTTSGSRDSSAAMDNPIMQPVDSMGSQVGICTRVKHPFGETVLQLPTGVLKYPPEFLVGYAIWKEEVVGKLPEGVSLDQYMTYLFRSFRYE